MNERGKSDNLVVPAKPPNNAGEPVAEVVEGRGLAEGNTARPTRPGRSAGHGVPSGLDRVREVARRDKDARFTALLHHVDLDRLWAAYVAINPKAAPGADQVTWDAYGQDLRENLEDLLRRVHSGAYRASPSRRVYIPKPDGRQRPLGIATLEDKILQRAVAEVLNAVYEEDFLGFSYGFRPGRGPHNALDALAVGITERKVNWILDADVSDFFSRLDHSWMERFLGHRIADKRVLRLIRKWMTAGVIEDGNWSETVEGSPQGGLCSAEHKPPPGYPFNRSSAGQSHDTSNRTNGHFGAMTSTNVGYLPRTAPLRWRAQSRLMNSAGLCAALACWPGDSDAGARALRITLVLKRRAHRLASQLSSSGSWFHSGRLSVTMS